MTEEFLQALREWRGVEDPCTRCNGSGVRNYGSTSTWRGGIGGAAITQGVCDTCWGTGDARRVGVDLRAQRDGERERIAAAALTVIARAVGARFEDCAPAINEIAEELERLSRGRKERPRQFGFISRELAKVLRDAVAEARRSKELG